MSKSLYITLALVMGALFAGATSVMANGSYGKKLEIAVDQAGKPKNLSIAYAYDSNWGWYITGMTTLKAEEIANVPEKVTVSLVDQSTGKVYFSNENASKKVLLFPTLMVKSETILREFLPQQKGAILTVSNGKGENLYYLSLADACTYSNNVTNLSRQGRPACVVDSKEFGNKVDLCSDQRERLLQYIGLGYTTCAAAKEIYAKMGCGDLSCTL